MPNDAGHRQGTPLGAARRRSRRARLGTALLALFTALAPAPAAAVLALEGEPIQGGLLRGRVEAGAAVRVNGEPVRVSPDGFFLVGFERDAPASAVIDIEHADERTDRQVIEVARRQYDIQRIDGLPERQVTPGEADLARIAKEAALVKAARTRDDARVDFLTGFAWPVHGRITGVYGSQRVLNGEPRRPHFGIDIAAPAGTEIRAPADGVVSLAHDYMFFSGGTLVLDHGHGLSTSYLHLSEIVVREGQRVAKGEVIGEVGATGRATGAHLCWRLNLFDKRLDPALLLGPMPP